MNPYPHESENWRTGAFTREQIMVNAVAIPFSLIVLPFVLVFWLAVLAGRGVCWLADV